jgi:septation ring formation regulator EzrA
VRSKGNEILSFLANIYEPCQRNNIKSTEIMKWIQDLLVNFSHNDISEIKKERNGGKDNFSNKEELIEIPLITQVDTFVEGKKHQYSDLRNKISELVDVLNKVSEMIIQKSEHLKEIEEKEKETIQYLHWYINLKDSKKKFWDRNRTSN